MAKSPIITTRLDPDNRERVIRAAKLRGETLALFVRKAVLKETALTERGQEE